MLRQVSKRNPNRCFVMSLPFVHSLWPAFAAQAAVVCIFKKQTLAADTPVQMQALRLRTPAHGSGWKIPSLTSLCAPNTHNMFICSWYHPSLGGASSTSRHSERTTCDSFALLQADSRNYRYGMSQKMPCTRKLSALMLERTKSTKWLQRFWMFSFLSFDARLLFCSLMFSNCACIGSRKIHRNFVGSKTLPALELPGKGGRGRKSWPLKMGRFGKLGGWRSTKLCDFVSFSLNEMFFFLVGGLLQVCLSWLQVLFWLEFWTKWNRTTTWLNPTDPHRIPPKTSGFLSARPLSLKHFRQVWCLVGMGIDGMYSLL